MLSISENSYHVLAKPTGSMCNLGCQYCFFLEKEHLYPGSQFRMPDDLLETYLRQLLESQKTPEVVVGWQGGEPTLMGLEFFQRSVALVEKFKKPSQHVTYTLQTNATLLDDDWCRFFSQHNFLIGLSVDGPQNMHDAYRVDKHGRGTFARVLRGWQFLQKHQVDFNVLCTIHAGNENNPLEVYRFLRDDLKAEYIQFIPIVEQKERDELPRTQDRTDVTDFSVRSKQFGRFLIAIFDEWARHDVGKMFVQHFDAALANWLGMPPVLCIFSKDCGHALALEHNGDLYSCDHFVEPDHRLGNIRETPMVELVGSENQRLFGQFKSESLPQYCRKCAVRFACHGGCPKNRFIKTPAGQPGLNYLCAGYRTFFSHINRTMGLMADLLRKGRYADEVMSILAMEEKPKSALDAFGS
ncbi:MAG: anaerobic sulfatase maturase [Desulfuromonas sp.]|uniref:anaerobic sulfatase maturase n=1 Tax=Desulfuromonas sp. TaxID=892 RepID=UPI000CC9F7AB|nr:anaerobic sulfatase maturase [Desulfuromonas sp.]PLX86334.1 MAG: anaerobic sulfatase maturase [Desulfuromonas sp.]